MRDRGTLSLETCLAFLADKPDTESGDGDESQAAKGTTDDGWQDGRCDRSG